MDDSMGILYNSIRITGVARTITDLAGIGAPKDSGPPIDIVKSMARLKFGEQKLDRVFMYNPDAIALWLYQKYTGMFEKAFLDSDLQIPMLSVMPTVTPVCFASMYTGAMPAVHGIQAYVKPVLRTDTVFDAYIRAGLRPAIVSTEGHSISKIFLERDMDYFIYGSYDQCTKKAMGLIAEDKYDLIVLYNTNYDASVHKTGTESPESMGHLRENIDTWSGIIDAIKCHWRGHRTMVGFCPDHGCHEIDGGVGAHGLDMVEDMNIIHFYRFI